MTTVKRPYINVKFNQEVDDGCLEYKSIPMAVVKDLIKINHATNDYTGIKQIYNLIPPRPKNINTMATSIARINNLTYNSVASISKQFIGEEIADTKRFVEHAPPEPVPFEFHQSYVPEQPSRSSTGERLVPTTREMVNNPKYNRTEAVSLILGDLAPTSGVVPYTQDMMSQTEWINAKEQGYIKRDIMFGYTQASADYQGGGMGRSGMGMGDVNKVDMENGNVVRHGVGFTQNTGPLGQYREGMGVQTQVSKPPSGKNIPIGMSKGPQRFFENTEDRFGTITGTPTRQLARNDKIARGASMLGESYTPKRNFQGDSATSGFVSPPM
jgi:hypothetical protein